MVGSSNDGTAKVALDENQFVPAASTRQKISRTAALLLLAAQGGIFYTFGFFAADLKQVGDYSETQLNLIGGVAYIGAMAPMLLVGELTVRVPLWVAYVANAFNLLGWTGLFLSVMLMPTPFWIVGLSISLVGAGVAAICPLAIKQLEMMHTSKGAVQLYQTLYIALYALSGAVGALVYGFAMQSLSVETRLQSYMAAQVAITLVVVVLYHVSMPRAYFVGRDLIVWGFMSSMAHLLTHPFTWLIVVINFVLYGTAVNIYNNAGTMQPRLNPG